MTTMAEEWHRLVVLLDDWAESAVADESDILVTYDGGRVVRLCVTPHDLGMLAVSCGAALERIVDYLTEELVAMPADRDHLVYTLYAVAPASSRANPEPPEPPMPSGLKGGAWFAYPPDR